MQMVCIHGSQLHRSRYSKLNIHVLLTIKPMKPAQWTSDMLIEALGWNMHNSIALSLTPSPFVATFARNPTHFYGFLGHALIPYLQCV